MKVGGSDVKSGIPQLAYTASFGNGFSATLSAESSRPYRTGGIFDINDALGVTGTSSYASSTAGQRMSDFVGNRRLDEAWGSLHFVGAVH